MKHIAFIGLGTLLSIAVGCAAESEPSSGQRSSPVNTEANNSATPPPMPGCTPLAQPGTGGANGPGMANPAAVYCAALGYTDVNGDCKFPDGTQCEEWAFFRGECGQAHSFCNRHGGTVANRTDATTTYAVCTLPNGSQCHQIDFARTCSCAGLPAPNDGAASIPAPPPPAPPPPACTPLAQPGGNGSGPGMADPAAVYCVELGYSLDGEQCAFLDGTKCEHWAFFRGECGQTHSFCNRHGGAVSNKTEDMGTWTASYAVCKLPSGQQCREDVFAHTCSCE